MCMCSGVLSYVHCIVRAGDSGVWGEEDLQELDLLTLCATWRVVMVRVCSREGSIPTIQVVDTTTDQVKCQGQYVNTCFSFPGSSQQCHLITSL